MRHNNDYERLHANFLTHSGPYIQRGSGIGAFFSGLFRAAKPLISKGVHIAKKIATSQAAKKLGTRLMDTGLDVASDVISGKDIREVVNEKLGEAKQEIVQQLQAAKSTNRTSDTSRGRAKKRRAPPAAKKKKKSNIKYRKKHMYNPTNKKEMYDLMDDSE